MATSNESELSFLQGYAVWLAERRRMLVGVFLLAVVAFVVGLWLTSTPQDAFQYEIF